VRKRTVSKPEQIQGLSLSDVLNSVDAVHETAHRLRVMQRVIRFGQLGRDTPLLTALAQLTDP